MSRPNDDTDSLPGLFEGPDQGSSQLAGSYSSRGGGVSAAANLPGKPVVGSRGVTRDAPVTGRGYGKGIVGPDPRKFRYDRTRGAIMAPVSFGATKADRLDATEAGNLLHRIHVMVGVDGEPENVLVAFDKALFFEHTINGASLLQPGRGLLMVGTSAFDLSMVKTALGNDQRRFFRAYADDIVEVNREVIRDYDAYDSESVERHGQLMQVAVLRGLQKYPYLAHDSSDAGARISVEERVALMGSKRLVLESVVNNVDKMTPRASAVASA